MYADKDRYEMKQIGVRGEAFINERLCHFLSLDNEVDKGERTKRMDKKRRKRGRKKDGQRR